MRERRRFLMWFKHRRSFADHPERRRVAGYLEREVSGGRWHYNGVDTGTNDFKKAVLKAKVMYREAHLTADEILQEIDPPKPKRRPETFERYIPAQAGYRSPLDRTRTKFRDKGDYPGHYGANR